MRRWLVAFVLLCLAPLGSAQEPTLVLAFDVEVDQDIVTVEAGGRAEAIITVHDRSSDGIGAVPGGEGTGLPHTWDMRFEYENQRGWLVQRGGALPQTASGQSADIKVSFLAAANIEEAYFPVKVILTLRDQAGQERTGNVTLVGYSQGLAGFSVQTGSSFQVQPGDLATTNIKLTNNGLYPRTFDFDLADNPCNVNVVPPQAVVVNGKTTETIDVTVEGPTDRFWYASQSCAIGLRVTPQDNTNIEQTVTLSGQVTGGYVEPTYFIWAVTLIGLLVLILFFIAARKARIEEEILGKPQKPWLIPVEKVYLDHLKERDPQAHYVVRNFLMEEEYQSALLWYAEFKKATKGNRAKERLVVAQEHKYERFQEKWQKRIAAPGKKADRVAAGLQKKLDRQGKAGLRKQQRKWKKLTKVMRTAHEKKVAKADKKWQAAVAKWEKKAAKAEKKGTEVPTKPAKPSFAEPDYPPAPSGDRLMLADHKWNKKAVRARAKAEKKAGNLEVKFEKKDAKVLRKIRKRVLKIARKLDDPEFESEHPLLASEA